MPGPQAAHEHSVTALCDVHDDGPQRRRDTRELIYLSVSASLWPVTAKDVRFIAGHILHFEFSSTASHWIRRPRFHFSRCGNPPLLNRTGLRTDLARRAARGRRAR